MSNEGIICSALLKTDPVLYQAIDGGNTFRYSVQKRGARTAKYRRYVNGDHDANLTDQMRQMLRLTKDESDLNDLNINYMSTVVDKMAGRLSVNNIESELEGDAKVTADEYVQKLLIDNDFEAIEGMIYRGAIRDADSYVMVDPRNSKWIVEPAYDGFSGLFALTRQGSDYPIWACKLYSYADTDISNDKPTTTVKMKVIVYQENSISYFTADSNGQEVYLDESLEERVKTWSLPIPIIHFANSKDSFTQFGESEVRKGIPLNDVLNRTIHSQVMASEFSAFKVAWSKGFPIDKSGITPGSVINLVFTDDTGKAVTELSAEATAFLSACEVGEFTASDISQYTDQIEKIAVQISHVTNTPIHGITTQGQLSGEALKQLENGLIGKCIRFQKENTGALRALIEMTAKVQKEFQGFADPPELGRLNIEWNSAELRDNIIDKEIQIKKLALETAANVYTVSNGAIAIETTLRMFNCFTEDELSTIGTQRLAAIKLEQEDRIPQDQQ